MKMHLQGALEAGATEQEISEMIGVTLLISGGSSVMWAWNGINEVLGKLEAPSSGGCCASEGVANDATHQGTREKAPPSGSCCG
jgi:hypothetical protein